MMDQAPAIVLIRHTVLQTRAMRRKLMSNKGDFGQTARKGY